MSLNPSRDFFREQAEDAHREQIVQVFAEKALYLEAPQLNALQLELRRGVALGDAPKTAEELHDAIYAMTGYCIPYTTTDDDDPLLVSPFEAIWRVYAGHWEKSLWWAGRESGKTYLSTLLHLLLGMFNPNHESLHAGGVLRQANIASKTLRSFSRDQALAPVFEGDVTAQKATFRNGALFEIAPGKYKSIDGQHPNFLSCDEVKHWGIKDLNQTWGIPSAKNDYLKRLLYASTNQDAGGGFNYLLDEAPSRNVRVSKWTVMETMEPCQTCVAEDEVPFPATGDEGDNQREKVCALWKFCRGKKGKRVTGWKPREEVCEFVISLGGASSEEARTQAFCEKPSTRGLVLHNFEHAPRKDGGNWTTMRYDESGQLPFIAFMDPAEANKCAIGMWHYYQRNLFQFSELIIENCASPSDAKEKFYWFLKENGWRDPEVVVVDPRKTDAIADWRRGTPDGEGIMHRYNAVAAPINEEDGGQEVEIGLREVRKEICDGAGTRRLFINPDTCPGTIQAIKNWMYKIDVSSGEIKGSAKPQELWKDEGDMIRYGVRYKLVRLDKGEGGIREFSS